MFDTTGVVHQDVQSVEGADRFVDDVPETVDVGDVGRDRTPHCARGPDLVGDGVEIVLGPGDERHVGSCRASVSAIPGRCPFPHR